MGEDEVKKSIRNSLPLVFSAVFASLLLIGLAPLVDAQPPEAPTLVWLENGENIRDNTPNLVWTSVTGADNYDV